MKWYKKKRYYLIIFIIILFISSVITNKNINTNSNIIILDKDNNEICLINNNHITNSIVVVPEALEKVIICIEDKTFYCHNGFDIYGIASAIKSNIFSNTSIGASTLTQQYIKNTYLNNTKTVFRKIKEIYLSTRLEKAYSKDEILKMYLSCIYFGNNVYGLINASNYYFSKELNELSIYEIISLVSLANMPSIYSSNLDKWNNKKNEYVIKLYQNNVISFSEYNNSLKDITLNINKEFIPSNRLFYITSVLREFNNLKINTYFKEPIVIKTDYDKNTECINSTLDINYSIISSNKEGYITSLIGNKNYYDNSYNVALDGKRDIGSTIKPLLYYEAIKCNINTINYSAPYTFSYKDEKITITNSSNYYKYSNINMYEALGISDNTYAVKTHLNLGMMTLVNHLKKYNIKANPIPSLALGSVGLALIDLHKIYTQFFSFNYQNVRFIKEISINNKLYKSYGVSNLNLLNKSILKQIDKLLEAPFDSNLDNSTCGYLASSLKTKCKGKSGLTDYDSYVIGYNDNTLVSIWVGSVNNDLLTLNSYKRLPKVLFKEVINKM